MPNIVYIKKIIAAIVGICGVTVIFFNGIDLQTITISDISEIVLVVTYVVAILGLSAVVIYLITHANVSKVVLGDESIDIDPGGKQIAKYFGREPTVDHDEITILEDIHNLVKGRKFSAYRYELAHVQLQRNDNNLSLIIGNVLRKIEVGKHLSNEDKEILYKLIVSWRKEKSTREKSNSVYPLV